ncbi:MAG: SDR family oxidoreductase [Anaerolineales bacterium]|nr:SDR family oxidoreductase [Anaerolineales bacterium]
MNLTRAMAIDHAPQNIRPVLIACARVVLIHLCWKKKWMTWVGARLSVKICVAAPMNRIATPEEVAYAVVFLASDDAFITGTALSVDGGRAA